MELSGITCSGCGSSDVTFDAKIGYLYVTNAGRESIIQDRSWL